MHYDSRSKIMDYVLVGLIIIFNNFPALSNQSVTPIPLLMLFNVKAVRLNEFFYLSPL